MTSVIRISLACIVVPVGILLAQESGSVSHAPAAPAPRVAHAATAAPAPPLVPEAPQPPMAGAFIAGSESRPSRFLVIRNQEVEPKRDIALQEDLAVMSRILEKSIRSGNPRGQRVLGIDVFFGSGSAPRGMYLEGYGAVFVLQVNQALLPTASKREGAKEQTAADSSWEEARQELYGGPGQPRHPMGPPAEEYSEEKVAALKEAVLNALKNASNIRELKPDESITVCLLGGAAPVQAWAQIRRGTGGDTVGRQSRGAQPSDQDTTMTIRLSKSVADDFAKGNINLDEVKNRAHVATYAVPRGAGGMGGGGGGMVYGPSMGEGYGGGGTVGW